jgi:hypothetical protein
MSTRHIIAGKSTTHGHIVHYRDHEGTTHAALITNIHATPATGERRVDLHVFDRVTGEGKIVQGVPHDREGGESHSWAHLPY